MNGDDSYSLMEAEMPQTSSTSMQPFFIPGAPEEFNEVFPAFLDRLARVLRPMLHSDPVWGVWAPRVHVDGGGIGADDGGAYGNGGFGAVPASGEAIVGLPERTVGESEAMMQKAECAVCLEGYEAGATVRMMPCSHGFHESCIFGWLRISRLCPLCRFALPAENETEEEDGEDG